MRAIEVSAREFSRITAKRLRVHGENVEVLIVTSHEEPVAAVVPYELFLLWQGILERMGCLDVVGAS